MTRRSRSNALLTSLLRINQIGAIHTHGRPCV